MKVALIFALACLAPIVAWGDEEVILDPLAPHHSFPHFWEQMFGSGRAILTLRDSYRKDLRTVKAATDFHYVRFHAILHDEIGVYDEDRHGKAVYNFSYVDQIYDGLLENGVRPFVEISFMPRKLAARQAVHSFKYHPIVAPPRDYAKWDALISAFAAHLIDRYGIDEVAQWYFEVWNEPNLDFWAGTPAQASYFTLYDHTAKALKGVNAALRVGGPSTAQAAWVGAFIRHASDNHVPLDFVSTHVYANDKAEDVFATHEKIPRADMVCRAAVKVRNEVKASPRPELPIIVVSASDDARTMRQALAFGAQSFVSKSADAATIGDIVLAYETIAGEAQAERKPLAHHIAHLAVHGFLHLLGYDHVRKKDAETMEEIERDVLQRLSIPDPYRRAANV